MKKITGATIVFAMGMATTGLFACTSDAELGKVAQPSSADPNKLDLLFVMDNSGSVYQDQENLAKNVRSVLDTLSNRPDGMPSVHIGVISTDIGTGYNASGCSEFGDNGALQTGIISTCTKPSDAYLADEFDGNGNRITNYEGELPDAFGCMAQLGWQGCGFEQPLASLRLALDPSSAAANSPKVVNDGFLRSDAHLAIVILTDEDDCSAHNIAVFDPSKALDSVDSTLGPLGSFRCTEFGLQCDGQNVSRTAANYAECEPYKDSPYIAHPDTFVEFLYSLKAPDDVMVSLIAGDRNGLGVEDSPSGPRTSVSCTTSDNGSANPAYRLGYFAEQFSHHLVTSICAANPTEAFFNTGEMIRSALGE